MNKVIAFCVLSIVCLTFCEATIEDEKIKTADLRNRLTELIDPALDTYKKELNQQFKVEVKNIDFVISQSKQRLDSLYNAELELFQTLLNSGGESSFISDCAQVSVKDLFDTYDSVKESSGKVLSEYKTNLNDYLNPDSWAIKQVFQDKLDDVNEILTSETIQVETVVQFNQILGNMVKMFDSSVMDLIEMNKDMLKNYAVNAQSVADGQYDLAKRKLSSVTDEIRACAAFKH